MEQEQGQGPFLPYSLSQGQGSCDVFAIIYHFSYTFFEDILCQVEEVPLCYEWYLNFILFM